MNRILDKEDVIDIVKSKMDSIPDIKYYIQDDYIQPLLDLVIEGVAEAIEINNKRWERYLKDLV